MVFAVVWMLLGLPRRTAGFGSVMNPNYGFKIAMASDWGIPGLRRTEEGGSVMNRWYRLDIDLVAVYIEQSWAHQTDRGRRIRNKSVVSSRNGFGYSLEHSGAPQAYRGRRIHNESVVSSQNGFGGSLEHSWVPQSDRRIRIRNESVVSSQNGFGCSLDASGFSRRSAGFGSVMNP
jgi:hypothetical protein